MKIMYIGAHFDDVETACCGSIFHHLDRRDEVRIINVTQSDYEGIYNGRKHIRSKEDALAEADAASRFFGVDILCGGYETLTLKPDRELINYLVNQKENYLPDRVYTMFHGDAHQDHSAIGMASLIAFKDVKQIFMYTPNSYKGAHSFDPNFFIDVTAYMEKKMQVLDIYQSEGFKIENWKRSTLAASTINGEIAGCEKAEAFMCIKCLETR